MLSNEEESVVDEVLAELERQGQTRAAEMATLLARLPPRPEVVARLVGRAHERDLPWVEYLARTILALQHEDGPGGPDSAPAPPLPPTPGETLQGVIDTPGPYPRRVDALLAALRGRGSELPVVVRRFLHGETDPFVLATMVAVLGQCGSEEDQPDLVSLLEHSDLRVVANALEALRRLKLTAPAGSIGRLLDCDDTRVRANAIALISVQEPSRAGELLETLARSDEPAHRATVAHLLGELSDRLGSPALLFSMLEQERHTAVFKQLARSLKSYARADTASALIGPLYTLQQAATGAKRSVLDELVDEVAKKCGLAQADVRRLGEDYQAHHDATGMASGPAPVPAPVAGERGARTTELVPGRQTARWMEHSWLLTVVGLLIAVGLLFRLLASPVSRVATAPWPRSGRNTAPVSRVQIPPADSAPRPQRGYTDSLQAALEGHLGPMGAPVDIQGTVVGASFGRTILECQGRHYMVLMGRRRLEAHRGDSIRIAGTLVGRSDEGIFLVDGDSR